MKALLATLGLVMAAAHSVAAQGIAIELVLDQEQYLPGESLPVRVRITNFAGQNLALGKEEGWLTFSVEDSRHLAVPKQGAAPVKGEFSLEPSMSGTKRVDLSPYFDLTTPGRYYVTATVTIPQWGQALSTKATTFDVIKGSSLWEQDFGVPGTGDGGSLPEIRRYALLQTLHSKALRMYFRLTDSRERQIFKIYPLGQMVSFSNPEPQIDKFSNLHVLYQSGGRYFVHCLMNPDGVLLARETYEVAATRPVLRAEKDGRITVMGGERRFMSDDLPPPLSSTAPANAKTDQP
jgi:hypothetical protein